ncbi:MAG: inorganic phosphate transporter [Candidatus Omnitrophota bacterium]
MTFFVILIALFLAMNVGANNTAAEMEAAYRAGVRTKKEALVLIAVFVILGAIIVGLPVVKTLGGGLVPQRTFKAYFYIVFVVMAVAAVFDFISNIFKISIPTSYAIVSSIAAVGLYYKSLSVDKSLMILKWWIVSPIVVFIVVFLVGKFLNLKFIKSLGKLKTRGKVKALLGAMLSFSGCYVAFAGGANGAAKAMGPVVAAGMIDNRWGVLLGGVGIAAGALIFGKIALEAGDREIAEIGFVRAILIEVICATVLLLASLDGIPLSVSVTVSSSLIGLGCADLGFRQSLRRHHAIRAGFIWFVVPLVSVGLTYFFLHTLGHIFK